MTMMVVRTMTMKMTTPMTMTMPDADADAQIAACGDWCIQGRVEAAFTSGSELGTEILRALGSLGKAAADTSPPGENHA